MDHFEPIRGELHAEGVPLARIAAEVGTPVYVYSTATLQRHARVFREGVAPAGRTRVAFAIKANPNLGVLGVLAKEGLGADVVSGGELARVSLALKVALAEATPPAALVFDEVDRGVGGAVADAVGERLQRLARTTQVLLVTHSPQVAARGVRHFRITRKGDKTGVDLLDDEQRLEELARMLSGAAVTDEARAAARRLLDEAAPSSKKLRKRA